MERRLRNGKEGKTERGIKVDEEVDECDRGTRRDELPKEEELSVYESIKEWREE